MTRHARAVVIGGGIMGVSTLYGLAANGWRDVVLCEKAELTSGSTWHAAGQIAHAVGSRLLAWINRTSIEVYRRTERETGQAIGWHPCGGLRIAGDDTEVDWLRSILGTGRLLDLPMELVGPETVARLNPFYDVRGVRAALRTFEDGHVDPAGATLAVAAAARRLGATVERRNRVTGAARAGDEWLVRTERGDIRAEHVVIAAGSYASQVGRWFGLRVPSASCLHHYLVTEPLPELEAGAAELPVMRDNGFGGYVRQEQRSLLLGVYESRGATLVWEDGAPWAAEHELFTPDLDAVAPELERAFARVPVLARLGIRRVVRGAITHTPDGGMLLGPAPGRPNLWLACGASIGIAWGGGAGKCLADLMVHGEAEPSLREVDPRRFTDFATGDYIRVKTREDFEMRHDTPVPGLQRPAGRPWAPTPLHDRLVRRGAVFGEVGGFERPRWFAGAPGAADANGWRRQPWHERVGAECRAVREAAGVIDLSAFTVLLVTGRDAGALLDRLSANRPPRRDGRIALCHFLDERGHFHGEATVTRLAADRYLLGSAVASQWRDRDWLAAHVRPGERVAIDDRTRSWGMLAVAGPASRAVVQAGTDEDLGDAGLPWLAARETTVFGVRAIVLRLSYTGELGFELHAPLEALPGIYDGLLEAGAPHGLRDFGGHALESLRLERAFRGSAELTPDVGLVEAGMLRFFHPEGREFPGREATLRRIERGAAWRLAHLEVDAADADARGGEPVLHRGRVVGAVTSGAYGHHAGRSLAFAYVRASTPAGADLAVEILGEPRAARETGAG